MPHLIGTVTDSVQWAHLEFIDLIKAQLTGASDSLWTVLRYDVSTDNHELILMGEGLTGSEQIYVGYRSYQSSTSDYYNIQCATMTGYVAGNTFATQPGISISSICAHNQTIDYWLVWNAQRIMFALKVGTPVYEFAYNGKFTQYARPSQYPYPVASIGTLDGSPYTRFSDTASAHTIGAMTGPTLRNQMRIRRHDGAWLQVRTYPYSITDIASQSRDTEGFYPLMPIELLEAGVATYGCLDGVFYVSGFNNIVENTITIGGVVYVVIQDVSRTGFNNYMAIEMEV